MTVVLSHEKKAAVVTWNNAEGETVDIEVNRSDGVSETIKEVKNTNETVLTFPRDFTGSVSLSVQGSKPDSAPDTGTISVA